ncbi:flagellar export protein FliJ [Cohnella cholangitidis]|uniref:Flagellar FliJ protein n=1 Tax=Cohnella cholangitidis TaxID=2598458 RepID=A0A7G5BT86_9BACL|nr:flagellar export protein FliJ [Cohnella cholangitidis]QMV40170.1 flagellar export protein FliJ [Cohnella cholangitidis]
MSFRYHLQKIVDLKGSEKSMAEWEYAASLGKLRKEEEQLALLFEERRGVEQALQETSARPTPLTELQTLHRYIEILDERITQQREDVRSAETLVRKRQSHLTDKMVDEKVWVNARERALERFRSAWLAKEQNELDEIAIVRAASAARG